MTAMKKALIATILAAMASAALVFGLPHAATQSQPANETAEFTLLHVNDIHGLTEARRVNDKLVGGYARLSTAVKDIKAANPSRPALLIDCGDVWSRGDALSVRTKGRGNVEIMNLLGFDFWTPGNGEFYDGIENLQARIAQAKCSVLAANVKVKATDKPLANDSVIRQVGPLKVAFFGLCTVRTEEPSGKTVAVADAIDTARGLVPQLRKQADVVVAVTHLGFPVDLQLAKSVDGIDVILGGHTHTLLKDGFHVSGPSGRSVMICQTGDLLRYVGQLDVKCVKRDGHYEVAQATEKLIALDDTVQADPAVTALIAKLDGTTAQPVTSQPVAPKGR